MSGEIKMRYEPISGGGYRITIHGEQEVADIYEVQRIARELRIQAVGRR